MNERDLIGLIDAKVELYARLLHLATHTINDEEVEVLYWLQKDKHVRQYLKEKHENSQTTNK